MQRKGNIKKRLLNLKIWDNLYGALFDDFCCNEHIIMERTPVTFGPGVFFIFKQFDFKMSHVIRL